MNKQKLKQFLESQDYEEISPGEYFERKRNGKSHKKIIVAEKGDVTFSMSFKPKEKLQTIKINGVETEVISHSGKELPKEINTNDKEPKGLITEKPQETEFRNFEIETSGDGIVKRCIKECQRDGHIQQVAYSTYHNAITQICFTCGIVRTSIGREAIKKEGVKNE